MKNVLKYVPKVLFFAMVGKVFIFNPDWPTAIVTLGISSVFVVTEYFNKVEKIESFQQELEGYKAKVELLESKTSGISDSLASLQISTKFRPVNFGK